VLAGGPRAAGERSLLRHRQARLPPAADSGTGESREASV